MHGKFLCIFTKYVYEMDKIEKYCRNSERWWSESFSGHGGWWRWVQLRIFIRWIEMCQMEYELVKSFLMIMELMGLIKIGGICMWLYVMDPWIINLSDFRHEDPSDRCPILHSHSIPCKILHIPTYTTPILILSMNLDRAKWNFHHRSHPSTEKFHANCPNPSKNHSANYTSWKGTLDSLLILAWEGN